MRALHRIGDPRLTTRDQRGPREDGPLTLGDSKRATAMADLELIRTISASVASGSVLLGVLAFVHGRRQVQTTFEDAIAREYRDIAGALPSAAFYKDAQPELGDDGRKAMFRYFDLSNEQLRLIGEGRVREETAKVWVAGITVLMRQPGFRAAWDELNPLLPAGFFTYLDGLVARL